MFPSRIVSTKLPVPKPFEFFIITIFFFFSMWQYSGGMLLFTDSVAVHHSEHYILVRFLNFEVLNWMEVNQSITKGHIKVK